MNDLTICKRNRDAYVKQARVDACDPAGVDTPPSPGYWELFFNGDPNSYFTDAEARLALCLYADMLEGYDWP